MANILIVYYSRKGQNYWAGSERDLKRICVGAAVERGLAIRGCEAAKSGKKISDWARGWV